MEKSITLQRLPYQIVAADPKAAWAIWQDNNQYVIEVTHGKTGKPLRTPVMMRLSATWTEAEIHLAKYVINSLSDYMPKLIPFALTQKTIFRVARHLKRSHTASQGSLMTCTYDLYRFFEWLHQAPDNIYNQLIHKTGAPDHKAIEAFRTQLEDYIDVLQARNQAPKGIRRQLSMIRTWMEINGLPKIHVDAPAKRLTYHDRAPTPEEIDKLLDITDIRAKVAICLVALGGFRFKTLAQLQYRHIKQDLEAGIIPIHVHVEEKITKGEYADYDTFLGQEAVEYLKAYLEYRRRGSPCGKIPPENINDESPIIRAISKKVKPLSSRKIAKMIADCFLKAGLVEKGPKRRELRAYSLRKYFDTNLAAAGVHRDYIDYMMGHVTPTYNSIKSKGLEFLRRIYTASNLSVKPKMKTSRIDILKEIVRSLGYDPEKVLVSQAFSEPHRTLIGDNTVEILQGVLRDLLKSGLKPASDNQTGI